MIPFHEWVPLLGVMVVIAGALFEGVRRLARVEAQLNNGITAKLARVEERQHILVEQISQIHGWVEGRQTTGWDGEERRQ